MEIDVTLQIAKYDPSQGVVANFERGCEISVAQNGPEILIEANPEGLRSLASHLLTLAQNGMPAKHHIHLDPGFGVAEDSLGLILQRK